MKAIRLILSLIVVAVLVLNLVGCAPKPAAPTATPVPPTATPTPPPTLVMISNIDDVVTLDPHHAYETTNLMIHASTYDTLVEFKPSDLTKVAPRLADSWEVSTDGLTYTFHLHPGIQFTSGNPVTAEDVRFSWTRLKNIKDNPAFYADIVADVQVVDDSTVKVILAEPSPTFLGICAAPAMSIVDSKVVKEHGGTDAPDADQTDKAKDWLDQNSAAAARSSRSVGRPRPRSSWKPTPTTGAASPSWAGWSSST